MAVKQSTSPISLDEFSASNPTRTGPVCWVCLLPQEIREQVDQHLVSRKTSRKTIVAWLTSIGHEGGTVSKMDNHFNGSHHIGASGGN